MKGNDALFVPSQPELVRKTSSYVEYRPQPHQENGVILYYQFYIGKDRGIPVIPDGCVDILFGCDRDHPHSWIASSPLQRREFPFRENCEYFCVRLAPDQNRIHFLVSMKELLHYQYISFQEGAPYKNEIGEELMMLTSFKERVRKFSLFLELCEPVHKRDEMVMHHCLCEINRTKGLITMKELANEIGYTDRSIRKKFEDYVGISPKHYGQIIRLQYVIQHLLKENSSMDKLIEQGGFYDEAHIFKEFKNHLQMTPKAYIQAAKK